MSPSTPSLFTPRRWVLVVLGCAVAGCGTRGSKSLRALKSDEIAELKQTELLTAYKPVLPMNVELTERAWSSREMAADALGRIGHDSVPQLIAAMSDPDPLVRAQAARALAIIGPQSGESAVDGLRRLLNDPAEEVRRNAARALGQIGPAAKSAIPDLMNTMRRPDSSVIPSLPK